MSEYGKELLSRVQKEFANLYAKDKKIKAITKKLANNSQSYEDANLYSIRVGELLSKSLLDNINENTLSGNFISRELADEILRPTLTNNYDMIKQAVLTVQTNQNKASNIGLQPQVADLNTSRIDGLVNKVSSYDTLDKGKWVLGEPVVNYSQAVVDDTAKKNMEKYTKIGMEPKIVRKAEAPYTKTKRYKRGKSFVTRTWKAPCDWCVDLQGTYNYEGVRNTGNDVYKRHEGCRCLVTYENGKKRQNVHSKTKWEVEEDKQRVENIKQAEENKAKEAEAIANKYKYTKQFKEATNYQEAKNFAENVLGVQYVSLDKVNINVLNKLNEDIARIYDAFGNLNEDGVLNYINGYTGKKRFVAAYTPASSTVQIRPNQLKSKNALQKFRAEAIENFKLGWWSNNEADTFIKHELGHAVEKKYYTNGTQEVRKKINSLRKDVINKIGLKEWSPYLTEENKSFMLEAGKYLSYYGLENDAEFIAEAVSSYMSENPKPLAIEVINTLLNGG